MKTSTAVVTVAVVIVKVVEVAPAGTVTDSGNEAGPSAAVLSGTSAPPAGAGADSVTLPVAEAPPCSAEGVTVSDDTTGPPAGTSPTRVLAPSPLNVALTNVDCGAVTESAVTFTVVPLAPHCTNAVAG